MQLELRVLRRKVKSRQVRERRGKFMIGTPIAKRPKEVKSRETFGQWELDTVVYSRSKSRGINDLYGAGNALLLSFQNIR